MHFSANLAKKLLTFPQDWFDYEKASYERMDQVEKEISDLQTCVIVNKKAIADIKETVEGNTKDIANDKVEDESAIKKLNASVSSQ